MSSTFMTRFTKISLLLSFLFFLILPPTTRKTNTHSSFFSWQLNAAPRSAKGQKEKTFRADFRDQNIQDFLKAMSAVIGKNIMVDDRVNGNITVISPEPIPVSQAYDYLLSVLSMRGMSTVEENGVLRVLPLKEAIARDYDIHFGRKAFARDENSTSVITHIMPIYYSKPSRLASLLKRVTGPNTELIDYDENKTIILTGELLEVNRLVSMIDILDKEEEQKGDSTQSYGNIHIIRLEHMQADSMEQTLRKIKLPYFDPQNPNMQDKAIEIYGFKETNSLVFVGDDEQFQPIKSIIEQLDIAREQVLLEVLIVEVSAEANNIYGIDWGVTAGGASGQFNTGTLSKSGLISKGAINTSGVNTLLGFSLGFLQSGNGISALLNANINKSGFTVLSAPQILTLNNQEAEINVGQDVPVVSGQLTSSEGTTKSVTVEYRPTGVKLKFTPNINNGRTVTLNIYGEVKEISGSTNFGTYSNPQFNKRDIKTSVRVNDNQTLVIGGLVSSNKQTNINKIPILGDIPLLGYMFKRVEKKVNKKNLLFFITPHIISNQMLADRYSEDMIRRIYQETEKAEEENPPLKKLWKPKK